MSLDAIVKDYDAKRRRLSNAEEKILIEYAQKGNKKALKLLVQHNILFCIKVANVYTSSLDRRDLIQAASIGLIKAIRGADTSRGLRLISFAVWWIKATVKKEINETADLVRQPSNFHVKYDKIKSSGKHDYDFEDQYWAARNHVSIDKKITADSDRTFVDALGADEQNDFVSEFIDQDFCEKQIAKVMFCMTKRERHIVNELFVDTDKAMTVREVATEQGCSRARIQDIKARAFCRVRERIRSRRELLMLV